jgi:hypothetical protein
MMFVNRPKLTSLAALLAAALLVGPLLLRSASGQPGGDQGTPAAPEQVARLALAPAEQPGDKAKKLKALREARLEAIKTANSTRSLEYFAGRLIPEVLYFYSRQVLDAELDLADNRAARTAAYQAHRDRMAEIEKKNKERFDAGRISRQDYEAFKAFRLEADIWLEQGGKK